MRTTDYLLDAYTEAVGNIEVDSGMAAAVCSLAIAAPILIQLLGDIRDELVRTTIALERKQEEKL